jgi:hypothetical protein
MQQFLQSLRRYFNHVAENASENDYPAESRRRHVDLVRAHFGIDLGN